MEGRKQERLYLFDNLKAILIFLVVLGHGIELTTLGWNSFSWTVIYLFHMPLFVFCSGYFAGYQPKKIGKLIVIYVVFQFVYVLFDRLVLGHEGPLFSFTTPHWIMWYLLALILWTLHLSLLDAVTNTKRSMIFAIIVSVALGIASGFDTSIELYMTLARLLYFLPFFVMGFCVRKAMAAERFRSVIAKWYVRVVTGALTASILVWVYMRHEAVDFRWFLGWFSYERIAYSGYTPLMRFGLYGAAVVMSLFVMSLTPRRKMFFSYIGQRTLPIFLLHGFVILLLRQYHVLSHIPDGVATAGFLVGISALMVAVFSVTPPRLRQKRQ
ncbi:MAG: acyltransferase family protein [Oscillospiraceae bacterium]|nr:acyltransferase family protein [Oscillospiraceae bacterium]